jgi:membrane protein implicated in regulation of membrane protease activity
VACIPTEEKLMKSFRLVSSLVAAAVIVGAVIALAVNNWWLLLIPVALHAIGTTIVMTGFFKRLGQGDKPDPVTEARLEEESDQPVI